MLITSFICSVAIGLSGQTPAYPAKHYIISENNSNFVVVKLNPKALIGHVFSHKYSKDAVIGFNTNYYWKRSPIGYLQDMKPIDSIWAYNDIRPVLAVDFFGAASVHKTMKQSDFEQYQILSQAGPLLMYEGTESYRDNFKFGKFRWDVVRATDHLVAGVDANNKMILLFGKGKTMREMELKCKALGMVSSMNFDGGSSASLKVGSRIWGNYSPRVGIEFSEK